MLEVEPTGQRGRLAETTFEALIPKTFRRECLRNEQNRAMVTIYSLFRTSVAQ